MATINEKTINTKCGRYGPQHQFYKCYECLWIQFHSGNCERCDSYFIAEIQVKQKYKKNKNKTSFTSELKALSRDIVKEISRKPRMVCCEEILQHTVDKIATVPTKVVQLMPLFGSSPDCEEDEIMGYSSDEEEEYIDSDECITGGQSIFDGKDMNKKFWSYTESDFSFLVQATEAMHNMSIKMGEKTSIFMKIFKKLSFSTEEVDKTKLVEDLICVFYFVYKMHLQKNL